MKKYQKMKQKSRKTFLKKYGLFTFACLISAYFETEYLGSLAFASKPNFINIQSGNRGVFSNIINLLSSGALSSKFSHLIASIIGSDAIANTILIILGALFSFGLWALVKNTYKVISRRIFLESRIYDKVPIQRFTFLLKVKKYLKASKTMLLCSFYHFLWSLTVIGYFIKRYSYFLVPYIVAENPDIQSKKAIDLSIKMMNNHKWECFKLELSFIGYEILGYLTLGLTKVFYSNPYKAAFFTEYYVDLRHKYLKENILDKEYLFDEYLYTKANQKLLKENYSDIFELIKKSSKQETKLIGFKGFLVRNFGISLYDDKTKNKYETEQVIKYRISYYIDALKGRVYPTRLYPIEERKKHRHIEVINYMKSYSIPSLILIFFSFAIVGWLWEVLLHLIDDGTFVNRGVLHGPWLPIYGWGGILILVLLYKLRKHPPLEFSSIIILCGLVEYFTSLYLEVKFGLRWWDYHGYFLNLHGRICAEGLLVFGLGGMAGVYLLAPLLDNCFQKLNKKLLYSLCVSLLCFFLFDKIYSGVYPNTGEGISSNQTYIKERMTK